MKRLVHQLAGIVAALGLLPFVALGASHDTVTIGLLASQTGPFTFQGTAIIKGFQLAMDEASNQAAGRRLVVITADEAASPDVALQKTQRLIEKDRVDILVGPVSSASSLAMRDYVVSHEVPWIVPLAMPEKLTLPPMASKYILRTQVIPSQANSPFGRWLYENKGYRTMAAMGMDFPAGRDSVEAFRKGFEDAGGEVVQELFTPIGNPDFGPFLTQLNRDVDAVYAWYAGADAIKFDSQYVDYGLKGNIPLTGFTGITEEVILDSVQDFVAGVVTVTPYTPNLDTAENRRFVQAYRGKYEEDPALPSANGYVSAKVLIAGLEAVNGDVSDTDGLLDAMRTVSLDSPRGPIRFDERGQVIATVYIAEARRQSGSIQNVVIDTIADIRQPAQ